MTLDFTIRKINYLLLTPKQYFLIGFNFMIKKVSRYYSDKY